MNGEDQTSQQPDAADVKPLAHAPPERVRRAQEERLLKTWKTPGGWRYWSSVNNSDVGLWYAAMAFFFFLFAGVLALLMRIQLAVPDNDFLSAELYNQAFTVHGSVMMFLFAIPIFEAVLGVVLLAGVIYYAAVVRGRRDETVEPTPDLATGEATIG